MAGNATKRSVAVAQTPTEARYGRCFECGEEIARPRLRALPFAVRCKNCEEAHEMARQRKRIQARSGSSSLGFELQG